MAVTQRNKYVRATGQARKGTAKNNQRKEGVWAIKGKVLAQEVK